MILSYIYSGSVYVQIKPPCKNFTVPFKQPIQDNSIWVINNKINYWSTFSTCKLAFLHTDRRQSSHDFFEYKSSAWNVTRDLLLGPRGMLRQNTQACFDDMSSAHINNVTRLGTIVTKRNQQYISKQSTKDKQQTFISFTSSLKPTCSTNPFHLRLLFLSQQSLHRVNARFFIF